uniref:Uncharacterized protein n=1 Tax=Plectus sambesii TaxID=2011161 RepID=A0A914XG09_9BILA
MPAALYQPPAGTYMSPTQGQLAYPGMYSTAIPQSPIRSMDQSHEVPTVKKRPSLMNDFSSKRMGMLATAGLAGIYLDTNRVPMETYTPQVENISPTPEDQPIEMPGKKAISEKLEKVEREIKHVDTQIRHLEKQKQDLEESAAAGPMNVDKLNENRSQSLFDRIYADNHKKAARSQALFAAIGLPDKFTAPLYHEPWDLEVIRENEAKHQLFKPALIQYVKRLRQAREIRERYLTERYNTLTASWKKKIERWEKNPKRIARDVKNREIFERTFPELKRQREERERMGRVERVQTGGLLTGGSRTEAETSVAAEPEEEDKKMRQAAVIPPMLLDELTRKRLRYNNRNGLVRDPVGEQKHRIELFLSCWTDDEKRIFKDRLMLYGKNFAAISMFLERKDTKDCVWFYYLTKKRANYKQMMRKRRRKPVKVYRAPVMPRIEDIEATANDPLDDIAPSKQEPEHHCIVCKVKIDSASNPGRVLTRACYEMYGLDASQVNPTDVRVCQKCRLGVLKNKYSRCPVGTCTTARRKVKPTRPMPPRWKELTIDQRSFVQKTMQIADDVTKCCSGCHKRILRKVEQLLCGELDEELATHLSSFWSPSEQERLRAVVIEIGTDNWDLVAVRMGVDRGASDCRAEFDKIAAEMRLDKTPAAAKVPGIESEDEDNSDDDEGPKSKKVSMVGSLVSEQVIKTESPEPSSSNIYAPHKRDLSTEPKEPSSGESNATLSADEATNDDESRQGKTIEGNANFLGMGATERTMGSVRGSGSIAPSDLPALQQ